MRINFDMDGTIADLYGVENWLDYLQAEDATPYAIAKPMVNLNILARYLNRLKKCGYELGVITWGAKFATNEYNTLVKEAKIKWLNYHLKSVEFDEIVFLPYGTPKENYKINTNDILFDDELHNRDAWKENAHDEKAIMEVLKALLQIPFLSSSKSEK